MGSISILFGNPTKRKVEKPDLSARRKKVMAKNKKKVQKKVAKPAKKTAKKAVKKAVKKVAKKVAPKKAKSIQKKVVKKVKKVSKPVQQALPMEAPKKAPKRRVNRVVKSAKVATPKKRVVKKAAKVASKPRKVKKNKAKKARLVGFTQTKSNMGHALKHGMKVGQTAKKIHSYKKRGKYEMAIRKISNPRGVMRVMKNPIPYVKHNALELSGLAVGGFATGALNAMIDKHLPSVSAKMNGIFKGFAGSVSPLLAGIVIGLLNDKFMKRNEYADAFAKGLIGAGVVGIGVTAANYVFPVKSTTTKGLVDNGFGSLVDNGFGSLVDRGFGSENQLGETEDASYTIGYEADSEDMTIYPQEDHGFTEDMETSESSMG